jgi:hypothetical protein
MRQHWTAEELEEFWTLQPEESNLVAHKTKENKLGFALILKHFQVTSFFPKRFQRFRKSLCCI